MTPATTEDLLGNHSIGLNSTPHSDLDHIDQHLPGMANMGYEHVSIIFYELNN